MELVPEVQLANHHHKDLEEAVDRVAEWRLQSWKNPTSFWKLIRQNAIPRSAEALLSACYIKSGSDNGWKMLQRN